VVDAHVAEISAPGALIALQSPSELGLRALIHTPLVGADTRFVPRIPILALRSGGSVVKDV